MGTISLILFANRWEYQIVWVSFQLGINMSEMVRHLSSILVDFRLQNRIAHMDTRSLVKLKERSLFFINSFFDWIFHEMQPVISNHYLAIVPEVLVTFDGAFVEFNYLTKFTWFSLLRTHQN